MFNLGLSEILLIAIVAILAIGPKELPTAMAHLGRIVKRLTYMRYAFTQQFDSFIRESGLEEVKNNVNFEAPITSAPDLISPEQAHQKALEAFQVEEGEEKPKANTKPKTTKKAAAKKTPATKKASAAKSARTKKAKGAS